MGPITNLNLLLCVEKNRPSHTIGENRVREGKGTKIRLRRCHSLPQTYTERFFACLRFQLKKSSQIFSLKHDLQNKTRQSKTNKALQKQQHHSFCKQVFYLLKKFCQKNFVRFIAIWDIFSHVQLTMPLKLLFIESTSALVSLLFNNKFGEVTFLVLLLFFEWEMSQFVFFSPSPPFFRQLNQPLSTLDFNEVHEQLHKPSQVF